MSSETNKQEEKNEGKPKYKKPRVLESYTKEDMKKEFSQVLCQTDAPFVDLFG